MLHRIAIWNRDKIIIAIAMAVWVTELSLLVNGKYLLLIWENFLYAW
jgi:hypothetical protein